MWSFEQLLFKTKVFIFKKYLKISEFLEIEVGAGGAVVHLSNPQKEYEEVLLKAASVLKSLF